MAFLDDLLKYGDMAKFYMPKEQLEAIEKNMRKYLGDDLTNKVKKAVKQTGRIETARSMVNEGPTQRGMREETDRKIKANKEKAKAQAEAKTKAEAEAKVKADFQKQQAEYLKQQEAYRNARGQKVSTKGPEVRQHKASDINKFNPNWEGKVNKAINSGATKDQILDMLFNKVPYDEVKVAGSTVTKPPMNIPQWWSKLPKMGYVANAGQMIMNSPFKVGIPTALGVVDTISNVGNRLGNIKKGYNTPGNDAVATMADVGTLAGSVGAPALGMYWGRNPLGLTVGTLASQGYNYLVDKANKKRREFNEYKQANPELFDENGKGLPRSTVFDNDYLRQRSKLQSMVEQGFYPEYVLEDYDKAYAKTKASQDEAERIALGSKPQTKPAEQPKEEQVSEYQEYTPYTLEDALKLINSTNANPEIGTYGNLPVTDAGYPQAGETGSFKLTPIGGRQINPSQIQYVQPDFSNPYEDKYNDALLKFLGLGNNQEPTGDFYTNVGNRVDRLRQEGYGEPQLEDIKLVEGEDGSAKLPEEVDNNNLLAGGVEQDVPKQPSPYEGIQNRLDTLAKNLDQENADRNYFDPIQRMWIAKAGGMTPGQVWGSPSSSNYVNYNILAKQFDIAKKMEEAENAKKLVQDFSDIIPEGPLSPSMVNALMQNEKTAKGAGDYIIDQATRGQKLDDERRKNAFELFKTGMGMTAKQAEAYTKFVFDNANEFNKAQIGYAFDLAKNGQLSQKDLLNLMVNITNSANQEKYRQTRLHNDIVYKQNKGNSPNYSAGLNNLLMFPEAQQKQIMENYIRSLGIDPEDLVTTVENNNNKSNDMFGKYYD